MAKGYKDKGQHVGRKTEREFITGKGIQVTLRAIPPLEVTRISDSVPTPTKPQYVITTASGEVEKYDHDDTTLETDEDKEAWKKYLEGKKKADDDLTLKILRAVLIDGVVVKIDENEFKRWKKRQELMGLDVSDDEEEMLLHYKETQVVGSKEDMEEILAQVMALSGITEEVLEEARKSFQGDVEPAASE